MPTSSRLPKSGWMSPRGGRSEFPRVAVTATFWWLPEEEDDFLRFLERDTRVVALPLEAPDRVAATAPRELIESENPARVFLTLRPYLESVRYVSYQTNGRALLGIDAMSSPVLSYSRCLFRRDNELGQGNISFHGQCLVVDGGGLVPKPAELVSWAKRVVARVRKTTPGWHQYKRYRVTDAVTEGVARGLKLTF